VCQRITAAGLLASLLLTSCSKSDALKGPPAAPSALPVRAAQVAKLDMPVEIQAIGNVEAYSSVTLKSRIAGQILRVHLRDGQDVREGQLLFELDPQPFVERVRQAEANLSQNHALLRQAEANVVRDQAQARQARAQADRYEALVKDGITSKDQQEQIRTVAEAADASLAANRAAVESAQAAIRAEDARLADAKLQLGYTKIASPISGRAGAVAVKAGNLIKENDVALVTILQLSPSYVSFAVPEQSLNDIRRHMAMGKVAVQATPSELGSDMSTGVLDFIDNTVDATTGTIRLKATFANTDKHLWPGQFVNVMLRLSTERNALVVPSAAVQSSQNGRYVWVIKPDSTAELRIVQVSRTQGGMVVVASGIQAGENVVTEGQLRLKQGAKVEILKSSQKAVLSAS